MNIEAAQNTFVNLRDRVHSECIVCGFANAGGLHLRFDVDNNGAVHAAFQCDKTFEGYPGMMHGGVISSILDGAMGNCMFAYGLATVTVEMITRFRHPVVTGKQAAVSARITRVSHPLYLLEAKIIQDGKVKAIANGKYYNQPKLIDQD